MDSLEETLENYGKKDPGAFLKIRPQNSFDKETVNFAQKKNFLTMKTFQSNWSQSNMEGESDFVQRSPFEGGGSAKNESSGIEEKQGLGGGNNGTMTFFGDEGSGNQSGGKQETAHEQKGSRKGNESNSDSNQSTPLRFPASNVFKSS